MNQNLIPTLAVLLAAITLTISVVVFLRVASNRRKKRERMIERRQMEERVAKQLERERSVKHRGTRRVNDIPVTEIRRIRVGSGPESSPVSSRTTAKPASIPVSRPVTRERDARTTARGTYQPGRISRSDFQPRDNGFEMGMGGALMGGLFSYEEPPAKVDDSPAPSTSSSNDYSGGFSGGSSSSDSSGSFDSGSSSSSDSGSFGGGDSGSF